MLEKPNKPLPEPPVWLTAKEVAHLLRMPVKTLYTWIEKGRAPPWKKIGTEAGYRFPLKKFEEWVNQTESK